MKQVQYNSPNTRARIEALRDSRKQHRNGEGSRLSSKAYRAARSAYQIGEALRNPTLKTQTWRFRRRAMRSRLAVSPQRFGESRNRQGVGKQSRNCKGAGKQMVKPGAQRIVSSWVQTGRLFSIVLLLLCVGAAGFLFRSPRFTVQQVGVTGNSLIPTHRVSSLAGLADTPIWFVNYDAAQQRLLQNSYIEQVRFSTRLPDKVTIHITERQPDVYWQVGLTNYLVDTTGMVLEVAQTLPAADTLVIEDRTHQVLQPHDRLDQDALHLAHMLDSRLPDEANLHPSVIGWDYGLGVYVQTEDQQTIIFGQYEEIDRKIALLTHMLQTDVAFTYLDLRPSNPFYQNKPDKSGESAEGQPEITDSVYGSE